MKNSIHSLGIDYGGSWIRTLAIDQNGKKVCFLKNPSIPIEKLPLLIKKILRKWKVKEVNSLIVGAKGVWKKNKRESLKQNLKRLAKNILVISDVEMAYQLTLGDSIGILILAGTGSIAYGKDKCGHWARAGGLGPVNGDEGSGYWIGSQWIRLKKIGMKDLLIHDPPIWRIASRRRSALLEEYRRSYCSSEVENFSGVGQKEKSVRKIASLAPMVIEKARRGEPIAGRIVQEAQDHLVRLVIQVMRQLHFGNEITIGCSGGLLKSLFFRNNFFNTLKNNLRGKSIKIRRIQKENLTVDALRDLLRPANPSSCTFYEF